MVTALVSRLSGSGRRYCVLCIVYCVLYIVYCVLSPQRQANLLLGGSPTMALYPIHREVESCYRIRDELLLDGPLGLHVDF